MWWRLWSPFRVQSSSRGLFAPGFRILSNFCLGCWWFLWEGFCKFYRRKHLFFCWIYLPESSRMFFGPKRGGGQINWINILILRIVKKFLSFKHSIMWIFLGLYLVFTCTDYLFSRLLMLSLKSWIFESLEESPSSLADLYLCSFHTLNQFFNAYSCFI